MYLMVLLLPGLPLNSIPDQQKLAQFKISPASFQFQVQTMVEGNIIGSILEKEQMTDIRMIYPNSTKNSLERLRISLYFCRMENLKPISAFASIR